MKTRTLTRLSQRLQPLFPPLPFAQRLSSAAVARARFPLPPLGAVGDPYLLDRLQAPLRRHRD